MHFHQLQTVFMASWNFPNEVTIFFRPFSSQLKSDPHCPWRQTKQHDITHQGVVTSDAVAASYSTSDGCDLPWGGLRILPWQRKKWSLELALRSWKGGGRCTRQAAGRAWTGRAWQRDRPASSLTAEMLLRKSSQDSPHLPGTPARVPPLSESDAQGTAAGRREH